jgi:hypothetical protein
MLLCLHHELFSMSWRFQTLDSRTAACSASLRTDALHIVCVYTKTCSYAHQESPPAVLDALRAQYPALQDLPWHWEGLILLGCPISTDEFVHRTLTKVCDGIEHSVSQFANVDDGLIHLQLHKFSINSMLPYFLRTASPEVTTSHARRIDALIWKALLDCSLCCLCGPCAGGAFFAAATLG